MTFQMNSLARNSVRLTKIKEDSKYINRPRLVRKNHKDLLQLVTGISGMYITKYR